MYNFPLSSLAFPLSSVKVNVNSCAPSGNSENCLPSLKLNASLIFSGSDQLSVGSPSNNSRKSGSLLPFSKNSDSLSLPSGACVSTTEIFFRYRLVFPASSVKVIKILLYILGAFPTSSNGSFADPMLVNPIVIFSGKLQLSCRSLSINSSRSSACVSAPVRLASNTISFLSVAVGALVSTTEYFVSYSFVSFVALFVTATVACPLVSGAHSAGPETR